MISRPGERWCDATIRLEKGRGLPPEVVAAYHTSMDVEEAYAG